MGAEPNGSDGIHLWNLKVDIPGHPAGSTISEQTLDAAIF